MTVDQAVRARLLVVTPLTTLVSTRIYTVILPQNPTLPAVRVQRISQVEPMHLRGPVNLYRARVQVDAVATTKAGADAVDAAVQGDGLGDVATGLKGWMGTISGFVVRAVLPIDVRDGYDADELKQFKVMRDFWVFFEGTQ